jgi:YidC/Oxa1 family membrane protein insertase
VMLYFIPLSVIVSGLFYPLGVLLYWFTSNVWTLGQQFYVNRYHPHVPEEKPTAELGKTLAPKPGAKPVTRDRRPVRPADPTPVGSDDAGADSDASTPSTSARPTTTPRPGARPARPGTNRPGGNRPKQAKKRR